MIFSKRCLVPPAPQRKVVLGWREEQTCWALRSTSSFCSVFDSPRSDTFFPCLNFPSKNILHSRSSPQRRKKEKKKEEKEKEEKGRKRRREEAMDGAEVRLSCRMEERGEGAGGRRRQEAGGGRREAGGERRETGGGGRIPWALLGQVLRFILRIFFVAEQLRPKFSTVGLLWRGEGRRRGSRKGRGRGRGRGRGGLERNGCIRGVFMIVSNLIYLLSSSFMNNGVTSSSSPPLVEFFQSTMILSLFLFSFISFSSCFSLVPPPSPFLLLLPPLSFPSGMSLCGKCKDLVRGRYFEFGGKKFHSECFVCQVSFK